MPLGRTKREEESTVSLEVGCSSSSFELKELTRVVPQAQEELHRETLHPEHRTVLDLEEEERRSWRFDGERTERGGRWSINVLVVLLLVRCETRLPNSPLLSLRSTVAERRGIFKDQRSFEGERKQKVDSRLLLLTSLRSSSVVGRGGTSLLASRCSVLTLRGLLAVLLLLRRSSVGGLLTERR